MSESELFKRLQSLHIFTDNENIIQETEADIATPSFHDNLINPNSPDEDAQSPSEPGPPSSKKQKTEYAFPKGQKPNSYSQKDALKTVTLYATGVAIIILCAMKMELSVNLRMDIPILLLSLSFFIPYFDCVTSTGLIHLPFALIIFVISKYKHDDNDAASRKIKKIYESMIILLALSMAVTLVLSI